MHQSLRSIATTAAVVFAMSGAATMPAVAQGGEGGPPPTIASFTPTSGHFPGVVTITGTNFTGATQVTIGGVPSAWIKVVSATQLQALIRSLAHTGHITVTTPAGTAESTGILTVTPMPAPHSGRTAPKETGIPPTVTSFTPTSGHFPDIVTITGTNFTGATQVTIGGVPSAVIKVVSATEIQALVRSLAHTGHIVVTTPSGTAESTDAFTVTQMPGTQPTAPAGPPSITSFTPTSGKFPDIVTITGVNFTGATQVAINGTPSAWVKVVSATEIQALVRSLAHSGHITVTTPAGTAVSQDIFTVTKTYD
jgi:cyanophycinase-like exopeptidase